MKTSENIYHSDDNTVVEEILNTIEELNYLKDVDAILDRILYEARRLSNADAGSIFICEKDRLRFGYVHNDTLFTEDTGREAVYMDFTVPINEKSIVGYVALNKEKLVIEDAYKIPPDRPYTFNPEYDIKSGYKTGSMLTIPLLSVNKKLVGVMQLINAKNENGRTVPFSLEAQNYLPLLTGNAAIAIERGMMNREMILRMVKMAELRDPTETGAHVQRVGAYSAELYQQWAQNKGMDAKEMKRGRDLIRLASMLHDVGKVGIPDHILKKPDKLTKEEFDTIKWHTVYGGRLFINQTSDLDVMSLDIALNHHEKWNGGGYPGDIPDLHQSSIRMGLPKKELEIPFFARIVAIADVYDALSTSRAYKESWGEERVLEVIESESGRHFDPDLVSAFFKITGVMRAIRNKYKE